MIVDLDTRKLDLKKGDMLIFDGERLKTISKVELLKPFKKDITKLRLEMDIQDNKIKKFINVFKGATK